MVRLSSCFALLRSSSMIRSVYHSSRGISARVRCTLLDKANSVSRARMSNRPAEVPKADSSSFAFQQLLHGSSPSESGHCLIPPLHHWSCRSRHCARNLTLGSSGHSVTRKNSRRLHRGPRAPLKALPALRGAYGESGRRQHIPRPRWPFRHTARKRPLG